MNDQAQPVAAAPREDEADDELLLLWVYSADEDPRGAEAALAVLYARHAGFLEAVCHKYRWHHPTRPARDFVNETFAVVFRERPAFAAPESDSPDSRRRAVRNFLCGICRFRFLRFAEKRVREFSTEILPLDEAMAVPAVTSGRLEEEETTPAPPARAAVLRFMESLEEENRTILLFSAPYTDPVSGHCRMPPQEARALSGMLGLPGPVVRQRRKRMMDKIQRLLEELPEEPVKSQ